MADIKDFTGAVPVDTSAEVTPITRQKIEKVTPELWPQMDINRLWDQRIILNDRMIKAYQAGHAEIALQIENGIKTLDALLQRKAAEEETKGTELI